MNLPALKSHEKYNQLNAIMNELMEDFDKIHNIKVTLKDKTPTDITSDENLKNNVELCDKLSAKLLVQLDEYIQAKEFSMVTINSSLADNFTFADALYTAAL